MKTVAVVTSNRAEFGILTPLIKRIDKDENLALELIVTGAHLSEKYGKTVDQIEQEGFSIASKIPILDESNTAEGVSNTIANAIRGFASFFSSNTPDLLVILGDRTEMMGVALAAMNENIPIAHIHGGEVTEGAVDECVRHSLTKLSYLHFASTEVYKKRIIQLGEDPLRVFNVGALGAENILKSKLMTEAEIREDLGIPSDKDYAIVTLHPETVDTLSPKCIAGCLCDCMEKDESTFFVITASNSDVGGDEINEIFKEFVKKHSNSSFSYSLGMKRYLSAVKYASFVLGNSSSGIIEAPILGTPTINIGDRQNGRIMPDSILNVPFNTDEISKAITEAKLKTTKPSKIYGDGRTSEKMVEIIKQVLEEGIDLKKRFYDLDTKVQIV